MKLSTFFIALFLTTQALGQPVEKIKLLLKDKDFVALNSYINKPPKSNVNFGWELLRTIVGNYQEGIIKIEENVPADSDTHGNIINNYRVYLLASEEKIFFYKFIKVIYKSKKSAESEKHEETIDVLTDTTEYTSFENLFRQSYGDTLNHNDLFLTSIVYGGHCGIAGTTPEYMEQLNFLLLNNKVDEIRKWLKSANAAKQLYAIRGYRILVNQGYNMTDEEKRIIEVVEQKKGTVSTCSGCIYMDESFQNVVAEINSIPTEYLKAEKTSSAYLSVMNKSDNNKNNWELFTLGIMLLAAAIFLIWRTKRGGIK